MNWFILVLAGLAECAFTFSLGSAKASSGLTQTLWYLSFIVFYIVSMCLLVKAVGGLPIGTAYAVWTGIGAVGTVLIGIIVFHEPAGFARLFFITTLILSIIGLKFVSS